MNKKLQLITIHNYQLINYLKLFQKKLNIENTNIIPQCNQENGYFSYIGQYIQIFSHFDSANIFYAQEDGDTINILLNSDSNSNGCTQWFNFKIQALQPTITIKFKILNNRRSQQLFTQSNLYTSKNNCFDIHYYKTNINHPYYANDDITIAQYQKIILFYTLEFKYTFNDNELITFAYTEPYPLNRVLQLKNYKIIGYTKLNKPIIKIKKGQQQNIVVILARQHPSETSGSFVAEELINIIDSKQYTYLIYPMVNPDGVFLGNSRCNTNGFDLNRKWINPKIENEPEIYYIKQSLIKYQQNIKFMIDLHGHSRKQNYFIFGCSNIINNNNKVQYFIKQFSNYKNFSTKDCSIKIKPNRQSTARQMFWNEFNIQYSITIEISMFGNQFGRFIKDDYKEIAQQIYQSIEQFNENNYDMNIQQILEIQNEENDSDDYDQDIYQDQIIKKQDNKKLFIKLKTQIQNNNNTQEDIKIKQQILPKIKNVKPLNKSEHKSSELIDIDYSFMYQLEQYKNDFSIRQQFPQRNIQPKRMSSIKRTSLNRDTTINIESIKKNYIFIN